MRIVSIDVDVSYTERGEWRTFVRAIFSGNRFINVVRRTSSINEPYELERTRRNITRVWLTSPSPLHVPLYRFRNEYAVKLVPLTREHCQERLRRRSSSTRRGLVLSRIEEKRIPSSLLPFFHPRSLVRYLRDKRIIASRTDRFSCYIESNDKFLQTR